MRIRSILLVRWVGPRQTTPLDAAFASAIPNCRRLGLDGDLPDIGDLLHMQVMGKVTFASKHETGGTRVELVLMLMKVEDEDRE